MDFFEKNILGGFFGRIFLQYFFGRIFLEDFMGGCFGRNSLFILLKSANLFESERE